MFVGVVSDKNVVVVVGSTRYPLGFRIVYVTCIDYVFRYLWVENFVGLRVECKCVVDNEACGCVLLIMKLVGMC